MSDFPNLVLVSGAGNAASLAVYFSQDTRSVQWIGVVEPGEIVNEILLSRAAWRRSRCKGAGVTTLFLLQPHSPAVKQCSGGIGGKSLGWIPHISTHYGHFVDTDPDSRQGVRVLVSNCSFHLIFSLFSHQISSLSNISSTTPREWRQRRYLPIVPVPLVSVPVEATKALKCPT